MSDVTIFRSYRNISFIKTPNHGQSDCSPYEGSCNKIRKPVNVGRDTKSYIQRLRQSEIPNPLVLRIQVNQYQVNGTYEL